MTKKLTMVLLITGFSCLGFAAKNNGLGFNNGPRQPQIVNDGQFLTFGNDVFVAVENGCNLSHARLEVSGDDVVVKDFKVIYDNNIVEDINIRERFVENSASNYKFLKIAQQQKRTCVIGFLVDAVSDRDRDRAVISLVGLVKVNNGDLVETEIGIVNVKEMKNRRERHQGHFGRPQRPNGQYRRN